MVARGQSSGLVPRWVKANNHHSEDGHRGATYKMIRISEGIKKHDRITLQSAMFSLLAVTIILIYIAQKFT